MHGLGIGCLSEGDVSLIDVLNVEVATDTRRAGKMMTVVLCIGRY
jgi:hypothetical protein